MMIARRLPMLPNMPVATRPLGLGTLFSLTVLLASGTFEPAGVSAASFTNSRPVVASTYFGGPGYDIAWQSAVDGSGNVYIAGDTQAAGFPVTPRAFQRQFHGGGQDGFLAKFNRFGRLLWSTYLGGSDWDGIFGVSVDPAGNALVTGVTASTDFPVTPNAVQHKLAGGSDAFVSVISSDGTKLLYSTYLGGATSDGAALPVRLGNLLPPSDDEDLGLAVKSGPGGDLFVAGETDSLDMPVTSGAAQPVIGGNYDCFVARINPGAGALVYLTYLGGAGYDYCQAMAVDGVGNAYVTGEAQSLDFPVTPGAYQLTHTLGTAAFITKINPTGTKLLYSTLLSGSQGSSGSSGTNYTAASAITIDAAGNAYVAGDTNDTDFPTTSQAFQRTNRGKDDGFVTELGSSGSSLVFSTYLGGSDYDGLFGLTLDPAGNVLVDGFTASRNVPLVGAFQSKFGGYMDAWVAKLSAGGSSVPFSSYLGGSNQDLAYGLSLWNGQMYLAGMTASSDFPVKSAVQPKYGGGVGDAFLTIVREP